MLTPLSRLDQTHTCDRMNSDEITARRILERIRREVSFRKLSLNRLPRWVRSARVRIGRINNSAMFSFEDSQKDADCYENSGKVKSDIQFLLEIPEFEPTGFCLNILKEAKNQGEVGLIIFQGEYGQDERTILDIHSKNACFFNVGIVEYHAPVALMSVILRLVPDNEVIAARFVPLAIFLNDGDIACLDRFLDKNISNIAETLKGIHNSKEGDYYQSKVDLARVFKITKEKSVIVLGKYGLLEKDLINARDYLRSKNYEAYLLKELPEMPMMSVEEKLRLWACASRFCVMIDREPSGHIAEHEWMKSQRTILAFIRQRGKESTSMIGDESIVDYNFLNLFEFENSPLEVLNSVILWAEDIIKQRTQGYEREYPWRRGK